jgi:UDP-N-acetylmuramate: L-alanyl-gamma-D-glutamyl-meso-diaminopimelate ligase
MQNAVGVIALLTELGVDQNKIAEGLKTFKGIRRRQEVRGVKKGVTVIDDFAHHPTAIRETIEAMRMRYPKRTHPRRRIFAIFEPRSNTSRRNIFQDDFTKALATADTAVLAGIHRIEKVPPEQRLDIARLVRDINAKGTPAFHFEATDDIVGFITGEAKKDDVILIMSNGGFDDIHEKILKRL